MTSKSELKRTATLDPVDAAERIYALERELANERAGQRAMDADWHEREERAHHLELENAALRKAVGQAIDAMEQALDHATDGFTTGIPEMLPEVETIGQRERLVYLPLNGLDGIRMALPVCRRAVNQPLSDGGGSDEILRLKRAVNQNGLIASHLRAAFQRLQRAAESQDLLASCDVLTYVRNGLDGDTNGPSADEICPLEWASPPPADSSGPLAVVLEQAEDEGLWFMAKTAPEAYLQAALRRLHAAIECHRERNESNG